MWYFHFFFLHADWPEHETGPACVSGPSQHKQRRRVCGDCAPALIGRKQHGSVCRRHPEQRRSVETVSFIVFLWVISCISGDVCGNNEKWTFYTNVWHYRVLFLHYLYCRFKKGAFQMAKRANVKVVPVSIGHLHRCWISVITCCPAHITWLPPHILENSYNSQI